MTIEIVKYTEVNKGATLGILTIYMPRVHMEIRGVSAMRKDSGQRWFNFPSRKYEDEDGETKYMAYIRLPEADDYKRFQEQMGQAFDQYMRTHRASVH